MTDNGPVTVQVLPFNASGIADVAGASSSIPGRGGMNIALKIEDRSIMVYQVPMRSYNNRRLTYRVI